MEARRQELYKDLNLSAEQKKLLQEKAIADSDSLSALTSLEENNIVLKFTRSTMGCRSLQSLASLTVDSLRECGLTSHVQIRTHLGVTTMTPNGPASPLEASVIELSKDQGRIFQFKRRMIVNFDSISILVLDMPIEDATAVGRIRDYVAVMCESGEDAVDNICMRLDANIRTDQLRQLAEDTRAALAKLQNMNRAMQSDSRIGLDQMIDKLESMYISLGLLDHQEYTISEVVRNAASVVMDLLDQGSSADNDFNVILENLAKASEFEASVDEGAMATKIDLF